MLITTKIKDLIQPFKQGGVFAYPTEAIYGLGCNPDDENAVLRLLAIKERPISKGLILIASDFSQVEKYLKPLAKKQETLTHPSKITYIFPTLTSTPTWLTGDNNSLAIRITKHLLVREVCETLNSALVSTSANLSGEKPAKNTNEVIDQLGDNIDLILEGKLGGADKPSPICDSVSGHILRK